MKVTPCKGCADRQVGCHAGCARYKEWRTEYDAIKDKWQKRKEANEAYLNYQKQVTKRMKNLNYSKKSK